MTYEIQVKMLELNKELSRLTHELTLKDAIIKEKQDEIDKIKSSDTIYTDEDLEIIQEKIIRDGGGSKENLKKFKIVGFNKTLTSKHFNEQYYSRSEYSGTVKYINIHGDIYSYSWHNTCGQGYNSNKSDFTKDELFSYPFLYIFDDSMFMFKEELEYIKKSFILPKSLLYSLGDKLFCKIINNENTINGNAATKFPTTAQSEYLEKLKPKRVNCNNNILGMYHHYKENRYIAYHAQINRLDKQNKKYIEIFEPNYNISTSELQKINLKDITEHFERKEQEKQDEIYRIAEEKRKKEELIAKQKQDELDRIAKQKQDELNRIAKQKQDELDRIEEEKRVKEEIIEREKALKEEEKRIAEEKLKKEAMIAKFQADGQSYLNITKLQLTLDNNKHKELNLCDYLPWKTKKIINDNGEICDITYTDIATVVLVKCDVSKIVKFPQGIKRLIILGCPNFKCIDKGLKSIIEYLQIDDDVLIDTGKWDGNSSSSSLDSM